MRQTATYAQPSPWRDIGWQLLLWVVFFIVTVLIDFSCTAHAGTQLRTVSSSRPSIRRLAKIQARAPVHVARANARAINGFPLRQAVANTTLALAYGAGTAYRVSGWIPTPGGVIANILIRPFRSPMPARAPQRN